MVSCLVEDFANENFKLICFSSVYSLLGAAKLESYSAANRLMEEAVFKIKLKFAINARTILWSVWKNIGISKDNYSESLLRSKGLQIIDVKSGVEFLFAYIFGEFDTSIVGVDINNNFISENLNLLHKPTNDHDSIASETPPENENIKTEGVLLELIAAVWKKHFPQLEKNPALNLLDLGIDSIGAIRIANEMSKVCGFEVLPFSIYEYPTLLLMTDFLQADLSSALDVVDLTSRKNNSGKEILCIPPASGSILGFYNIAQQMEGDDCKIKSFIMASPSDFIETTRDLNIAEVVELYLEAMDAKVNCDDLILVGWSFGAVIAYELIARLQSTGWSNIKLVLIDPPLLVNHEAKINQQLNDNLSAIERHCLQLIKDYQPSVQIEGTTVLTSTEFDLYAKAGEVVDIDWSKYLPKHNSGLINASHDNLLSKENIKQVYPFLKDILGDL